MRLPKLCHHRPSGRAFVKLDGRFHYRGAWDSSEARQRYRVLCDDLLRDGRRETITHLTIDQLRVAFLAHCGDDYLDSGGKPTGETSNVRDALQFLEPWRHEPAAQFGPRKLKAVREAMISVGIIRKSINKRVKRIVMMFAWAASEEMLPAAVHQALSTVAALRKGRSKAVESEPVLPVFDDDFCAALSAMTPPVAALCRLLYLTGRRVSEGRLMSWDEIDRTVSQWRYEPENHKTAHRGKRRVIWFGPKSQLVLRPIETDRGFVFRSNPMFN